MLLPYVDVDDSEIWQSLWLTLVGLIGLSQNDAQDGFYIKNMGCPNREKNHW